MMFPIFSNPGYEGLFELGTSVSLAAVRDVTSMMARTPGCIWVRIVTDPELYASVIQSEPK